jgi:hypothetical protein
VLRHQLQVLRRQIDRPALYDNDRTLPGAIAASLPRHRRVGWIVTPDTLLRWLLVGQLSFLGPIATIENQRITSNKLG